MIDETALNDPFPCSGGTGDQPSTAYEYITVPFDRYEITIRLTPRHEFVCVTEVKLNKDFLTNQQRTSQKGFLDVDDFYRE